MRRCNNWIGTYLSFTEKQESPEAFHLWVSLGVVGAALGRKVWIDRGYYKLYPNLYIILVAGSAMCRKSVALNIGRRFLEVLPDPPNVIAQKVTNEALISSMKQHNSTSIIFAPELAVFLGKDAYYSGLLATLTDMYDCPDVFEYETIKRGTERVENVWLSLFGASTPDWLKAALPGESIKGGFTSRVMFVYVRTTEKKANAQPTITTVEKELRDSLVFDLGAIQNLEGEFVLSEEGSKWFNEWYEKFFTERDGSLTEETMGYYGRKHDLVLKLSMIISASYKDSLMIDKTDLESALGIVDRQEKFLDDTMEKILSSDEGEQTEYVLGRIRRGGKKGVQYSRLLRDVSHRMKAATLKDILSTLLESGQIERLDGNVLRVWEGI